MTQYRTKAESTVRHVDRQLTIPAGEFLIQLKDGRGFPCYAVASRARLISFGACPHDSTYYYCWIPESNVEAVER